MHREEATDVGSGFERFATLLQVDQAICVHIDEDRDGAGPQDGEGGREGAERGGEDAVAGTNAEAAKSDLDGVEAVAYADGVLDWPVIGERALEGLDMLPEDVPTAGPHAFDRVQHVRLNRLPLPFEIIGLDVHRLPWEGHNVRKVLYWNRLNAGGDLAGIFVRGATVSSAPFFLAGVRSTSQLSRFQATVANSRIA